MKSLLFFFTLILAFSAEAQPQFVDAPAGCFRKKAYPCKVRVSSGFLAFEKASNQFHLGESSSLLFLGESEVQLLQGQLWVPASKHLVVRSTSALKVAVSGEWFFQRQENAQFLLRNLDGEIRFLSRFVFASETLPVGFENWYGTLDSSGQISRGVIRPIDMKEFLTAWMPLAGSSVAEMRKATLEYKQKWGEAVSKSASLYQEVVERRMASHEDKARRQAERKRSEEAERERIRQMFREKNGLLPE